MKHITLQTLILLGALNIQAQELPNPYAFSQCRNLNLSVDLENVPAFEGTLVSSSCDTIYVMPPKDNQVEITAMQANPGWDDSAIRSACHQISQIYDEANIKSRLSLALVKKAENTKDVNASEELVRKSLLMQPEITKIASRAMDLADQIVGVGEFSYSFDQKSWSKLVADLQLKNLNKKVLKLNPRMVTIASYDKINGPGETLVQNDNTQILKMNGFWPFKTYRAIKLGHVCENSNFSFDDSSTYKRLSVLAVANAFINFDQINHVGALETKAITRTFNSKK